MCGIVVFFDPSGIDLKELQASLTSIRHRGPDDEGYTLHTSMGQTENLVGFDSEPNLHLKNINTQVFNDNFTVALGHRRLSIIDVTSAGHQPMNLQGDNIWISYNGEVYNYVELKKELVELGVFFKTGSDTEVILAAYKAWGESCVGRFTGMFAFCILDYRRENGKEPFAFIARDQLGIKPLYWTFRGSKGFAFGSEISTLQGLSGVDCNLDLQSAFDYLMYGRTDHSSRTFYRGIFQLQPGHAVKLRIARNNEAYKLTDFTPFQYWRINPERKYEYDESRAQADFFDMFMDSMRMHLRSDVKIGAALSGGLDSSSIVSAMRLLEATADINTFTFTPTDEGVTNEEHWALSVANAVSSKHYTVTPNILETDSELKRVRRHQNEPFHSSSIYAQYCVFKAASQKSITVMLDGQGPDEMLAGYDPYKGVLLSSFLKSSKYGDFYQMFKRFTADSFAESCETLKWSLYTSLPQSFSKMIARKMAFGRNRAIDADWINAHHINDEPPLPPKLSDSLLRDSLIFATTGGPLQALLRYEDRNSMAFGIESRVPFITPRLAEFCLSLPDSFYYGKQGRSKNILRVGLMSVTPANILARKDKIGFVSGSFNQVGENRSIEVADDLMISKHKDKLFSSHLKVNSLLVFCKENLSAQ
jgi:asparagine synthase (glutamine-hydrolysing)